MSLQKIVEDHYDLKVIGFIRLSQSVLKMKTKQCFYCLKFVDNTNIESVYNHLAALQLQCFVKIIKNNQDKILTSYQDQRFYLMPYLQHDQNVVKELKLRYFYECLGYLHNRSFFQHHVSQAFFDQQKKDIIHIIQERMAYYDSLMNEFEVMNYRSPSGWMLVLNYYRIHDCLKQAQEYLEDYYQIVSQKHDIRLSLVYNHFNYQHIFMEERKLISIDQMKIDFCIYDIFNMYQTVPELSFHLDSLFQYYLDKVYLYKEEKLLLKCLLSVVPIIHFNQDEVNNIIKMSRLLYYLDSIHGINKKLTIDE